MWFKLETGNMTYNRIEDEMKRNSIIYRYIDIYIYRFAYYWRKWKL